MERGLFWLPLLALFFWLAWAGWNEYQKVEAYRLWAQQFQQAKYDLYAVLGQQDDRLTWGKPTRKGPIDLQTFSLREVQAIRLVVDGKVVEGEALPNSGKTVVLEFARPEPEPAISIPFTEVSLAARWKQYLEKVGIGSPPNLL